MKIETLQDGTLNFKEVFSGIQLETESGNKIGICMRDNGFEITYQGKIYEAKNNLISLVGGLDNQEVEDKEGKVEWINLSDEDIYNLIKNPNEYLKNVAKNRYDISEDRNLLLKLENGTKGYFDEDLTSNKNYFTPSENGNHRLFIDGDKIFIMSAWDLLEEPKEENEHKLKAMEMVFNTQKEYKIPQKVAIQVVLDKVRFMLHNKPFTNKKDVFKDYSDNWMNLIKELEILKKKVI